MPLPVIAAMAAQQGMGMIQGAWNDARQIRQNKKLGRMNLEFDKEMTDYQQEKALEMWQKTGYTAQVKQMKEAGLNPGLQYGMSGGGGMTIGHGAAHVAAGDAPKGGGELEAATGMGIQLGLLDAQKRNIEADTKLKEVDARKREGVDTEEAASRIDLLKQGLDNARWDFQIKKLEVAMKNLEVWEQQASQEDRLDKIEYETKVAMRQLQIITADSKVAEATVAEKIKIVQEEAIGAVIRNAIGRKDIDVKDAQIKKWATEIAQGWKGLSIDENRTLIDKFEAEIKAAYPNILNAGGRVLNDGLEALHKIIFGKSRPMMNDVKQK